MHFSDDRFLSVMVKILSTGEIVQDDDPRAQQGGAGRGGTSARPRQVCSGTYSMYEQNARHWGIS